MLAALPRGTPGECFGQRGHHAEGDDEAGQGQQEVCPGGQVFFLARLDLLLRAGQTAFGVDDALQ